MKNMYKYALLFALAGGAALFTGCRADEEVDLAGYPETPVGATISGTTDRVATFAGTYDNEGVLNLAGSLSGEYTIALAQASPEETVVRVEPIITNVPAELVEISARELVIPAGSTTVAVSVRMIEENYDFMENVFGPVTYELGVRVVEARGSQVPVVDGEAKMVIEKAAYVAVASLVGVEGNAVTFKRNFIDGAIVNEDPITYDVKVVVDRPVLEDTKFVVKSAGIPEGFVDDERFTPAAEVTIPAGAKEKKSAADVLELENGGGRRFPSAASAARRSRARSPKAARSRSLRTIRSSYGRFPSTSWSLPARRFCPTKATDSNNEQTINNETNYHGFICNGTPRRPLHRLQGGVQDLFGPGVRHVRRHCGDLHGASGQGILLGSRHFDRRVRL